MTDPAVEALLATLTPDIVANLRRAIEIGKWPDGRRLSREQTETCMQAVLLWEMRNLPPTERTGYIDKGSKEGEVCDSHDHAAEAESRVKFLH